VNQTIPSVECLTFSVLELAGANIYEDVWFIDAEKETEFDDAK
jgi:hypothetical protein